MLMHLGGYNGFYMMVGSHIYTDPGGCCFVNACIGQGKKYFFLVFQSKKYVGTDRGADSPEDIGLRWHPGCTDCSYIRQSDRSLRPGEKQVALSESVYGQNSVAAIAVAAHECGHVLQHAIITPPFPSGQHWSRLQILVPVLPGFLSWEGFCLVFSR